MCGCLMDTGKMQCKANAWLTETCYVKGQTNCNGHSNYTCSERSKDSYLSSANRTQERTPNLLPVSEFQVQNALDRTALDQTQICVLPVQQWVQRELPLNKRISDVKICSSCPDALVLSSPIRWKIYVRARAIHSKTLKRTQNDSIIWIWCRRITWPHPAMLRTSHLQCSELHICLCSTGIVKHAVLQEKRASEFAIAIRVQYCIIALKHHNWRRKRGSDCEYKLQPDFISATTFCNSSILNGQQLFAVEVAACGWCEKRPLHTTTKLVSVYKTVEKIVAAVKKSCTGCVRPITVFAVSAVGVRNAIEMKVAIESCNWNAIELNAISMSVLDDSCCFAVFVVVCSSYTPHFHTHLTMQCITQHCTCTLPNCTGLHSAVQCSAVQHHTPLYCITLHCITLQRIALLHISTAHIFTHRLTLLSEVLAILFLSDCAAEAVVEASSPGDNEKVGRVKVTDGTLPRLSSSTALSYEVSVKHNNRKYIFYNIIYNAIQIPKTIFYPGIGFCVIIATKTHL